MKLLPSIVLVLTALAGTACQRTPPKPENVSAEPASMTSTAAPGGAEKPTVTQLDPAVLRLKEQLSLSEQQTNKLNEIFEENRAQRKAIHARRITLTEQRMALQKKKLEQINSVLTTKQARKYEKISSEPPPEVMGKRPDSAPVQLDPVIQLKKQLKLNKQQTNKLNEIFQNTNAQREVINAQGAALRNQIRELQKNKLARINAVLTAEQAKKYEQIRSEPPPEIMKALPPQPTE
ncbi:MAG: hypothetical protein ACU88J_03380 [Gammaproteobacteria bacterium]